MYRLSKSLFLGIIFLLLLVMAGYIMVLFLYKNPNLFILNKEGIFIFQQFFILGNTSIIPLIFGALGAFTRVLISDIKLSFITYKIILGSACMSLFSWISIKSGIWTSLLLPQLDNEVLKKSYTGISTEQDFYSMILISIFVGMFSTNIYIVINSKVEAITRKNTLSKEIKKDDSL